MPYFSKQSLAKLDSCHNDLIELFTEIIKTFDCTIKWGFRPEYWQNLYFKQGSSKVQWPNSKHNTFPSKAVDAVPYITGIGATYEDRQCYFFAGYVLRQAEIMGINIRLGADWDSDKNINDQAFRDICHFEIIA
uniref:Putative structural protein n=1 Tax=viral metagenome TaxID=1070528 RepID=A0A6M3L4L6_9ZZZZ